MLFGPIAAVVVIASLALLVRQLNPPELRSEVAAVAGLSEDSEEEQSTSVATTSPFAVAVSLVADTDSPASANEPSQVESLNPSLQVAVNSTGFQVDESDEGQSVGAEELPVSDSTLALVTAQERGISNEAIAEPLFEQMASADNAAKSNEEPTPSGTSVQLANVTLTRPMLALDDDEIEIVVEIVPEIVQETVEEIPIVEPVLSSQQDIMDAVPEVATLEPVSIDSLPRELVTLVSAPLSPQLVVQSWLDAWEGQNLEQYFASYDDDFVPRYHRSKSAWQSNRERVIGNASQISLEMSDFAFISEDAEIMEVHFWLAYSSPSYRDDTRKKLVLKKIPASDQGVARLVILEEINLEVRV